MFTEIINSQRVVTKTDIDLNFELDAILQEYKFTLIGMNTYSLGEIQICWVTPSPFNRRITNIYIYIKGSLTFQYYERYDGKLINENEVFSNHQHLINHLMDNIRTHWNKK